MTPLSPAAHWYDQLRSIVSLGSMSARPGSLAGLHEARKAHLAQFFSPDALARFVWDLVSPAMEAAIAEQGGGRVALLDNSIGSGRLIQFADPEFHTIAGADIHQESILKLQAVVESAGFSSDLVCADMATLRPKGFGCCLINPPYSITLDSPLLEPFSCTTWGTHGKGTSCVSHAYAVHQALDAAAMVVAIVPKTYADQVRSSPTAEMEGRLRAVFHMPKGSFKEEGTDVSVSVLVFGHEITDWEVIEETLSTLGAPDFDLQLECLTTRQSRPRDLDPIAVQAGSPSIPGAVTGNKRVRVVHSGRRIRLKFECALTHAKVINGVFAGNVMKIEGHRYPKGVKYIGQGKLDLQLYLAQPDPQAAFGEFLQLIQDAGGEPFADPGLLNHLRRSIHRQTREGTPFGHVIKGGILTGGSTLQATVRNKRLLDPIKWGSPLLRQGDQVVLEPQSSGGYAITVDGVCATLQEEEVSRDFNLADAATCGTQWREAHPSRAKAYPQLAKCIHAELERSLSTHVASWSFQINDLVELRMSRSSVLAWRMGCGKGRAAIALCLAGGRHNAIVVESHLIGELVDQIYESGLDEDLWQIITSPAQCKNLRKINILSYSRLRRPITEGAGRRTYASLLRRRLSTVVADEAHLLRHLSTAQTQALWMLSPRRRYAMTGTPIANQVQDILPLAQWAAGDGTVNQPYGRFHPYLEPRLLQSMSAAYRGVDKFADDFTIFEWVSRGFADGLEQGAKRQVPKIKRIEKLRSWAAPILKRRHETEPDVAAHFHVPEPIIRTVDVAWDDAHLSYYLRTADEFAAFYREALRQAGQSGKNLNLSAILVRIGAVLRACNFPQHIGKSKYAMAPYFPLTSKQRAVLDRAEELTNEGHKTVIYADNPGQCGLLVSELAKRHIPAVRYDGSLTISERTKALNQRFRKGSDPVLVSSMQVVQKGLNLWQADRELFLNRSWSATVEDQAMRRLLRPQQTRQVEIEMFHLMGSIDIYQGQMCSMKSDSAGAAIDFLTPEYEDQEFIHLDVILNNFVNDLSERNGLDRFKLKEGIHAKAA